MGTFYVDGSRDGRCSRECGHELELWTELEKLVLVAMLLLPMCCGSAGTLGEMSGANTATSTCKNSSTIFKTNTPFLVSSNFIHTCSLAVQQLFPGPTFYMS